MAPIITVSKRQRMALKEEEGVEGAEEESEIGGGIGIGNEVIEKD